MLNSDGYGCALGRVTDSVLGDVANGPEEHFGIAAYRNRVFWCLKSYIFSLCQCERRDKFGDVGTNGFEIRALTRSDRKCIEFGDGKDMSVVDRAIEGQLWGRS